MEEVDLKIGCVVLAAGQSRRFGRNKLLEPLAQKPVLLHVLDMLPRESLDRLVAVVGSPEAAQLCCDAGMSIRFNKVGPLSHTIRLGIQAMEGMDGCLFVMGDQPLCTTVSIRRILAAFGSVSNDVLRLSNCSGPGSPVLFPQRLFGALATLAGEQSGMKAVKKGIDRVHLVQADYEFELWDADTPEDRAKLESCLEFMPFAD